MPNEEITLREQTEFFWHLCQVARMRSRGATQRAAAKAVYDLWIYALHPSSEEFRQGATAVINEAKQSSCAEVRRAAAAALQNIARGTDERSKVRKRAMRKPAAASAGYEPFSGTVPCVRLVDEGKAPGLITVQAVMPFKLAEKAMYMMLDYIGAHTAPPSTPAA